MIQLSWLKLFFVLISCELFYVDAHFECDKQSVPCGCGFNQVKMNTRLTGSEDAVPYSWSMIVSLRYDCHYNGDVTAHCCSGTILSESYILTSAHCANRINSTSIISGKVAVFAGIHHRSQESGTSRIVDQIYIHPKWIQNSNKTSHNIAILHLTKPFNFVENTFVARTCRPSRFTSSTDYLQYPADGTSLALVGWNSMQTWNLFASETLQQTAVQSLNSNDSVCASLIENIKTQFCARLSTNGTESSDADGSVFRWIGDRWEQVGIMASNIPGGLAGGHQRVFTRIASYHDWIESIVLSKKLETTIPVKISESLLPTAKDYPIRYRCDRKTVSCGCSREQVVLSRSRIFGGEESVANSWSMIVSLRFNGSIEHGCGGSILNDFFILTAAHCVEHLPISPTGFTVVGGVHNVYEGGVDIMEVDRIYMHPNYTGSSGGYLNDIAILHLSESLAMNSNPFLARICVPYSNNGMAIVQYPSNGASLAVIGWGKPYLGTSNVSNVLRQAEVFAIDNDDPQCKLSLRDTEKQFCAGRYDVTKDSCPGDSGGPMFEWKGNFWQQVGITSYRNDCGIVQRPSVYTRLAYYFDWMERVINGSLTTTTKRPTVTNPPVTYTCDKTAPCGCGYNDVAVPSSRIINGNDAVPYSWSMVVSLRRLPENEHICGGSILDDFFVLTAAHCVMNRPTIGRTNLSVAVGGNRQFDFYRTVNEVDRIYIHPEWVPGQQGNWNDIAILHLSQPLNLSTNRFVKRTCLQRVNSSKNMLSYPLNGTRMAVIGWGISEDADYIPTPENLQQVELFVIDKRDEPCDKSIKDKARQFCAGIPGIGGKDSCRGDSGGPMLQWMGNRWEQVGIVSYGKTCGNPRTPTVFTQVGNYIDWIENVMNEPSSLAETIHHLSSIFLYFFAFIIYIGT